MMNIIEYQEPKPTLWQKCKTFARNTTLAVTTAVGGVVATVTPTVSYAALEVNTLTEEISGNKTGMSSVALTILGLIAFVVGVGMIRRIMK